LGIGVTAALIAAVAFAHVLSRRRVSESTRRARHHEHELAPRQGREAPFAAVAPDAEDARVVIGRALFFDPNLSTPAGTSCASCHDPNQGYAGTNGASIGTARGSKPGHFARRNTPSVMYLRFVRRLHVIWDDDADHPELSGGFFWDGRADTIAALVRDPLLHPDEMGNRSLREIARKIEASAVANALRSEFDDVFASAENTVVAISFCIEAFLTSRAMSPFSSKYDDFVRGEQALSALEQQGLRLFEDPNTGACSGCHRLDHTSGLPESSMFTDYGYDVVAVPRNRKLAENRDARRFDLGVCERRDPRIHTEDPWFCGAFRTPSLRNVAKRTRFMHNGYFANLRDVVSFYATRSTDPERWFTHGELDDLPMRYRDNLNLTVPPYNQLKGQRPRLSDEDVDAIVAFLETLSDRDVPGGTN
jgi:cytochrome c peroxidase